MSEQYHHPRPHPTTTLKLLLECPYWPRGDLVEVGQCHRRILLRLQRHDETLLEGGDAWISISRSQSSLDPEMGWTGVCDDRLWPEDGKRLRSLSRLDARDEMGVYQSSWTRDGVPLECGISWFAQYVHL